jgi:hypothetical protein
MASPPPGGYSQYAYGSTSTQQVQPHTVHQQLYRPTEGEAAVVHHENPNAQHGTNVGKRLDKVEKGIGGFLKKLDKRF